jgi:hypothetical protein
VIFIDVVLGLANRGLGSLEAAQDEKSEAATRMQALEQGNQFFADSNLDDARQQ